MNLSTTKSEFDYGVTRDQEVDDQWQKSLQVKICYRK